MAIKELFQDSRPQVLFDPRASQRIDPRFKFTRDGVASYYDKDGVLRYAPANQPRVGFNYEPDENGVMQPVQGLLLEAAATNYMYPSGGFGLNWNNNTFVTSTTGQTAVDGSNDAVLWKETIDNGQHRLLTSSSYLTPDNNSIYTLSFYAKSFGGKKRFYVNHEAINVSFGLGCYYNLDSFEVVPSLGVRPNGSYVTTASMQALPNGWTRIELSAFSGISAAFAPMIRFLQDDSDSSSYVGDPAKGFYFWGFQIEKSPSATSYVSTTSAEATRAADLLSIEGTSLPSTGSIYIDARSLTSDVDDTLLSAANASDDKLALAIREPADLYSSKALVYEVDGAFKPTLPFPVPSNVRERNLITYGANNYHYRSDSSRLTPSSSSSVPANMTRLGIGHDVTDPTKAFTGYINTVYLWPGEITPTVAEALVRGDLDPQDADAGVFTPETGALAFVFNTQGTATDGDRVVELPVSGSTNNILVDWGDNTSSSFIGAAASSTVSHTYPSAGIYPVQITADDDGTNSGLETLTFFNSSQRNDLVRVLQWGGSTTWQPTTMYRAFRDCTQLDFENAARTNLPDTSAITNWGEAFYNCSNISGTFPTFDTSAATTFTNTWDSCTGLTAFPFIDTGNVTNFDFAWDGCTGLTGFPLLDTSSGTSFFATWRNCNSLTSFPLIDTSSAGSLSSCWVGCSSLTSFPALDTSSCTSLSSAWEGCSGLTSFPLINTASVANLVKAWDGCSSLTSFPLINTASVTSFGEAWENCSSLTSFPLINTAAGTTFTQTWSGCSSLTSFPSIDTSSATTTNRTWRSCSSLTSFPLLDLSNSTTFEQCWNGCSSLTSFPLIDTSSGTNFSDTWFNCISLTSFPLIDTSSGTIFYSAWYNCTSLTSFPAIDTSSGTNFFRAWRNCSSLTSFPAINTSSSTTFYQAWYNCTSLTSFPANFFDSWTGTPGNNCFVDTWNVCSSLTATSVENILNSIDTSGQSAPASGVDITISYNGGSGTPSIATAVTNLKSRGWTITLNGVAQ